MASSSPFVTMRGALESALRGTPRLAPCIDWQAPASAAAASGLADSNAGAPQRSRLSYGGAAERVAALARLLDHLAGNDGGNGIGGAAAAEPLARRVVAIAGPNSPCWLLT